MKQLNVKFLLIIIIAFIITGNHHALAQEVISFEKKGKWGLKDATGKEVLPAKYDHIGDANEGMLLLKRKDKFGFADASGKEIVPPTYDSQLSFSAGLSYVKLNGKWGYIDKSGALVIPIKYDNASYFNDGTAAVKSGGKAGFIDPSGKIVIELKYEDAYPFHEGLAGVKNEDRYGYINKSEEVIVPFKYLDVGKFHKGHAAVTAMVSQTEWKKGFIDNKGNEVTGFVYESTYSFSGGMAMVSQNKKIGFVNEEIKFVVPPSYDDGHSFNVGLAPVNIGATGTEVWNKKGGKWGYIDNTGTVVVPIIYDEALPFRDSGIASVKLNGEQFFINKQGKRVNEK